MNELSKPMPPMIRWVLWAALSGSVFLYLAMLRLGFVESGTTPSSGLLIPLTAVGFVLAIASMGIRFAVRQMRDRTGRRTVPTWIFPAFIIALALAEAAALFGFILGFLGHGMKEILPLFAISVAALLLNNPASFFPNPDEEF